jgi:arginyl-tRNA synthetase
MKEIIEENVNEAIKSLFEKNKITIQIPKINIEIPKDEINGDFATNAAFLLTKILKRKPLDIANEIVKNIPENFYEKIEIAGPGFINFFLKKSFFHYYLKDILSNPKILKSNIGNKTKIQVEFVSANPTGPLHIGHGRGAAYGDSIARILSACNYNVQKEYYINDAGNQMNNLAKSIYSRYMEMAGKNYPFPEDGYKGDYIIQIARNIYDTEKDHLAHISESEALSKCLEIGKNKILKMIETDLKDFNVEFDNWFSEKSLYESGAMDETIRFLKDKNKIYEKDGALWFKSQEYGDDKDRVLKKQDGSYTYFASDIAYHKNKFDRGFEKVIDVWGADHHGYVKRLSSSIEAMGYNSENFKVVLIQMVSLINAGEKISMSTRAGEFIPLSWLTNEVGKDAARFFYAMRNHESQFEFDVELAKSNSSDNPVYYVQYAHARVQSLIRTAKEKNIEFKLCENLDLLTGKEEINLIKKIYDSKNILELSAKHLEPHRIAYYLQELAGNFHSYYYNNKIINENNISLTNARLNLATAVGITIKFGLELLGVQAPNKM